MQIGPFQLTSKLFVAPMAGVTDRPFRQLCRSMGAGLAVSEMVNSRPELWQTRKSLCRTDHRGEAAPISVQIAGADPRMMAAAARHNVAHGAQIIDINMGCPAKKVCNVMAGSALLRDEPLVARIVAAVVAAVDVPVTLKIRTGWDPAARNAVRVARIAESEGIAALAIHGRTRACGFGGSAEYDTIAEVKTRVRIPVIANGDIDSPASARSVLRYTGADAIMIGRAAQGRPWIFREIEHYLATGVRLPPPSMIEIRGLVRSHLQSLYEFYGEDSGVRVARKHVGWYARELPASIGLRASFNRQESVDGQLDEVERYFDACEQRGQAIEGGPEQAGPSALAPVPVAPVTMVPVIERVQLEPRELEEELAA
jgi:tRNA-dihydrouridine synthase B